MAYTAKDYSALIGLPGFSETLLKNHFTLYQGYVTNTNKLSDLLGGMLAEGKTPAEVIDALFIRCDGRMPTEKERIETLITVLDAADTKQALEDVFWALLNSPEFIFNH